MNVDARYTGTRGAFALDVAFQCPMHGITALFGRSGCGKTTVLRCVAGLQPMNDWLHVGTDTWQDESGLFCRPHERPIAIRVTRPIASSRHG